MKDTLLKKFLKFSYGSWAGLILGLITTMLITRILSPEALGVASMFDLFIQVGMVLIILGTDQTFIRFFYEENKDKRGALLYSCLRIPLIISLITMGLVIIFHKPITQFLFGLESLQLSFLLAVGILAQLLLRFSQLVIRMQQKGNLYSLLQIFHKLFNLSFILIFFHFIGSTFEILIYSTVFTFLTIIIIAIYFGRQLWATRNFISNNTTHSQKEILKFGAPFILTTFIFWLFEAFDKIAIRQWSTFEELGLYTAAMRLVALVMVLKTTFSVFWTPVAYERFENSSEDRNFFRYISILVSFAMFLVAIISIAAKELIVILLGNEYQTASDIMPFLVFIPIFYTISETTVIGINFHKKINWHILIASIACGVNILGNWLFVPSYGALGAAVSTAISYVVFFTLRTVISLKYFKVSYPLVRIYIMAVLISIYAYASIVTSHFWLNIIWGLIPLTALLILYYRDIIFIVKNGLN
ncbi:oligosaccharide flippase family protein [Jeotgalibacillus sp. ET6]|uniref:lipopolysaccharide biosynthesis protein n=1 Tax=Jeotgalibacillus sp. ET6 TaxID=3037260 RepID=UPI0024182D7A|nr:oligosaccharide flippase family protein [Jeotgalibacillus sp. ET6]MDG5471369.1 oligosaccharide flippase family protein [Jeotgalibacillus sp. ET6]